jgi:hypothetical protein
MALALDPRPATRAIKGPDWIRGSTLRRWSGRRGRRHPFQRGRNVPQYRLSSSGGSRVRRTGSSLRSLQWHPCISEGLHLVENLRCDPHDRFDLDHVCPDIIGAETWRFQTRILRFVPSSPHRSKGRRFWPSCGSSWGRLAATLSTSPRASMPSTTARGDGRSRNIEPLRQLNLGVLLARMQKEPCQELSLKGRTQQGQQDRRRLFHKLKQSLQLTQVARLRAGTRVLGSSRSYASPDEPVRPRPALCRRVT